MNGILILAHGSRREDARSTVDAIAERLKKKLNADRIWIGYMEMSTPCIGEAIDDMVRSGVKRIFAVPMFLLNGIHMCKDIPEELEKAEKKYPELQITIGKVIGEDERLADILADRAVEAGYPVQGQ